MTVLVVLAHPVPGSFNHAIAAAVRETLAGRGHEVLFHDLCAEEFDPLLKVGDLAKGPVADPVIAAHCRELAGCDGIIFIHPNWWGQPPAILKGWIDRVVRPGVAYEFLGDDSGEGVPRGLLTGKKALVFNTSDTPPDREREVFGDPLELIWKKCIFEFCGITEYSRKTYGVIVTSTAEQRKDWLEDVRSTAGSFFGDIYMYRK